MTAIRYAKFIIRLRVIAVIAVACLPVIVCGAAALGLASGPAHAGKGKGGRNNHSSSERGETEKSERTDRADRVDRREEGAENSRGDRREGQGRDGPSENESATANNGGGSEGRAGQPEDKSKSRSRAAETDKTQDQSNKVPGTVEEWLNGILKPKRAALPAADADKDRAKHKGGARSVAPDIFALPAFERPELLVVNASKANIEKALALNFRVTGRTSVASLNLGLTRLMAPDGTNAEQAQELLKQAFPPGDIETNKKYRIFRTATGTAPAARSEPARDPIPMATPCGTDRCFGASIIGWSDKLQECARSVRVGVIDTGYDRNHPAFRNRHIEPRDVKQAGRSRSPDWHGTGILALLAGETKSGTPGLVPDAKLYIADIFYADTDGAPASDTASLLEALDWLDKQKVSIINMSLTGPPDELLKQAIVGLSKKGIMFVAAAGNDGPSAPPSYPAAYEPVLAVTAVDSNMKNYRYASRGAHVDVAAPGVEIWTAMPQGQAGYHSGTSFAVPYVTAVLAAAYRNLPQKTKAEFLKQATVLDLGAPGRDPIYGNGLLVAPLSCNVLTATAKPAVIRPAGLISQNP